MKSYDCKQCKVAADRSIFLTNLFKKLGFGGKTKTEVATVCSKRLASARFPTPGSTWDYWLTFTLTDGSKTEVLTTENQYHQLPVGQSGRLTWEGDKFLSFEHE